MRVLLILLPIAALAGCATVPPPAPVAAPAPVVFAPLPGLERVIDKSEATATALLGKPTLDRREGPGHHLQYARPACILDLYFYPNDAGQVAARYAAARLPDGKPIDAGDCFRRQTARAG